MEKILFCALLVGFVMIGCTDFIPPQMISTPMQRFVAQIVTSTPMPTDTPLEHIVVLPPTPTPVLTSPVGQTGKWQLQFSADFDGDGVNGEKWVTCFWWDNKGCTIASNHELQWYQRSNVSVGDGMLRLQARRETITAPDDRHFAYTSGMISSGRRVNDLTLPPKFAFQYGYVEMRAKAPRGQGLWSAFWLLPVNHTSRPEIDVMEILGHEPGTVEMHFHYDQADGKEQHIGKSWSGSDLSNDWHVFAVDWQPDRLIWYVDGVERWRFSEETYIPAEPMYILVNLAVGGDWPGAPDAQTPFPSDLLVDYIRVWQR